MPYLAVAIGGFLGAIARFAVSEWVGHVRGFPLPTLLINLSGCFVLAWFYTFTMERVRVHPVLRLGIGTGFIGAFTTFSTFTVDTWKLVDGHAFWLAFLYVSASVFGGLFFAWIGYTLAIHQSQLRMARTAEERM